MSLPEEASSHHSLQCMEIWGGSHAARAPSRRRGSTPGSTASRTRGRPQGGDVHYVSLCGGGIITRLIVADVSGHGAAVAEFAASLRTLMRQNINRKSQTRLVGRLNRQFAELAQCSRFATAVVATYLASTDRLTVCNAGHPRPLWYQGGTGANGRSCPPRPAGRGRGGDRTCRWGSTTSRRYDQFAILLGRGDLVVFYTDALIEAKDPAGRDARRGGPAGPRAGAGPRRPHGVGPAVRRRRRDHHRGERPADDDVTFLVLHHNAGPPRRPSLGEKLDVYAKVFGLKSV